MPQVAVRAMRIIARALVVPIANYAGGEDQQRDQRQGDSENANRFVHFVYSQSELGSQASAILP